MRNLAAIVMPAVLIGAVALALDGRVDGRVSSGALALAIVPAPLVASGVVGRMNGRADLAGALTLGTVLLSLLIVGSRGSLAAGALFTGTEAYAIAAMFGNAIPRVRDAALVPLRVIGWGAFLLLLLNSVLVAAPLFEGRPPIGADPPLVVQSAIVAAVMLAVGIGSATAVARRSGRDLIAVVAGAGLRDPALAVALTTITAGPDSTGVPLVYGVFCLVLAGIALRFT